jgi:PKD repeat protein
LVGLIFLSPGIISVLAQAPANDDFDGATVIPNLPFTDTINTTEATMAGDDPGFGCWYTQTNSVWYAFTPDNDMWLQTDTVGSSYYTSLGVFTGTRGNLSPVASNCSSGATQFQATGGVTYYFIINSWSNGGGPYPSPSTGGDLVFHVSEIPTPANDNLVNATVISALPFSEQVDTNWATTEMGEPTPTCGGGFIQKTIWYAFTPATSASYTANISFNYGIAALAVYTGTSLNSLVEIGCRSDWIWWGPLRVTVKMEPGTTYYFQTYFREAYSGWAINFWLEETPPPNANFSYWPNDPNVYDSIQFYNNSYDPVGIGIQSTAWDFGDGATSTEWSPVHRYVADGAYTAQLSVTTNDGRTASTSQVVQVRTHDVTITRFIVPQSARAGQTRQLTVELNNKRYPETVEVQLYKSTQSGYVLVGTLTQYVPVRPANRTTIFAFSHTFTNDDATLGKVNFRAVANLVGARDGFPTDNEAIALPCRVTR